MENISYQPSEGLSYNPNEEKYWDSNKLNLEIERTFEICHGCRMCFKYCDSFPSLFKSIDAHEGDVKAITKDETQHVMDQCFQCKLCEVQCPYSVRDKHEFQLDFPKLVHRYMAIKSKDKKRRPSFKKRLRSFLFGNPDLSAVLARLGFGMANVMNRVKMHRYFMEKMLGIHRHKLLPNFSQNTFDKWAKKNQKIATSKKIETVLFQTCYVQNNEPDIGKDVMKVMGKNKVACGALHGLECCGMPVWEQGNLDSLRQKANHNMSILMPYIESGAKVLVINPTCAMMMRREYPELVDEKQKESAKKLAQSIKDPAEYLWNIRNEDRFNADFKSSPGEKISYHAPCHLRAQSVGFHGRDLLKKLPGTTVHFVAECCGHDGTYAMKKETFEASKRAGRHAFEGMKTPDSDIWATECPLAAIQFEQHAGRKAMNPLSILARAYEVDGFKSVKNPKNEGNKR